MAAFNCRTQGIVATIGYWIHHSNGTIEILYGRIILQKSKECGLGHGLGDTFNWYDGACDGIFPI